MIAISRDRRNFAASRRIIRRHDDRLRDWEAA
jgi:hypothetical protein